MIVYGFHGPSGTGKSFLALTLCHQRGIDDFIDDGIYIHQGRKVAGRSAKYESNKIAAVKRAIFHHPDHRQEVKQALCRYRPQKLLIIGTSTRMIHKIVQNLDLPEPTEWIDITDVSSAEDIEKALFTRRIYGQHVIPIPHIQVEKDRFQQLIEKVKSIFDANANLLGENTIVHPKFHGGRIIIKKSCLKKIVLHNLKLNRHVHAIQSIRVPSNLYEPISINLSLYDHIPVPKSCSEIRNGLKAIFEQMLSISLSVIWK